MALLGNDEAPSKNAWQCVEQSKAFWGSALTCRTRMPTVLLTRQCLGHAPWCVNMSLLPQACGLYQVIIRYQSLIHAQNKRFSNCRVPLSAECHFLQTCSLYLGTMKVIISHQSLENSMPLAIKCQICRMQDSADAVLCHEDCQQAALHTITYPA